MRRRTFHIMAVMHFDLFSFTAHVSCLSKMWTRYPRHLILIHWNMVFSFLFFVPSNWMHVRWNLFSDLTYDRLTIEKKYIGRLAPGQIDEQLSKSAQSADFSVIFYSQEAAFPPGVILEIRMYLEKGKQCSLSLRQLIFIFRQSKRRLIGAA